MVDVTIRRVVSARVSLGLLVAVLIPASVAAQAPAGVPDAGSRDRSYWVSLAEGGFVVPEGRRAVDLLLDMTALLASPDPVLRDEVAYSAAERWILRDKRLSTDELRRVVDRWTANLQAGLGETGSDRVFLRSFSALCLSVAAAADVSTSSLEPGEVARLFDQALDYFAREHDTRGFDPGRGWMHSVAHTADLLKFLVRNPKLPAGTDRRLLDAVRAKLDAGTTVFAWGENDRVALALHSAVRRADASGEALTTWVGHWVEQHRLLWSRGPHVDPAQFARVENAKQVMRGLHAALLMEATPTPAGTSAASTVLGALARMR